MKERGVRIVCTVVRSSHAFSETLCFHASTIAYHLMGICLTVLIPFAHVDGRTSALYS